ncbi:MAG: hypothetical protein K6E29_06450 [Cyanobacteria bacterium RUI128]|nr:hypothetical protein [Cyanobacteria bacterium RUI128]
MAKTVSTVKNEVKLFGIKIFESVQNYIEMTTDADVEAIRDDIILHENIIKNRNNNIL